MVRTKFAICRLSGVCVQILYIPSTLLCVIELQGRSIEVCTGNPELARDPLPLVGLVRISVHDPNDHGRCVVLFVILPVDQRWELRLGGGGTQCDNGIISRVAGLVLLQRPGLYQ